MLDTNVLVSALLFPNQRINTMMEHIFKEEELVLSSYVVEELKYVFAKKFPNKEHIIDKFLMLMNFEYVYTPQKINFKLFKIRDLKDYPVLYTAIMADVDILITGDKDFESIRIEQPHILTPTEFIDIISRDKKWKGGSK